MDFLLRQPHLGTDPGRGCVSFILYLLFAVHAPQGQITLPWPRRRLLHVWLTVRLHTHVFFWIYFCKKELSECSMTAWSSLLILWHDVEIDRLTHVHKQLDAPKLHALRTSPHSFDHPLTHSLTHSLKSTKACQEIGTKFFIFFWVMS